MCWVAIDRGLRLADKRSFPAPRKKWYKARDKIYTEIMEKGWSRKLRAFKQAYENEALDAANLVTYDLRRNAPQCSAVVRKAKSGKFVIFIGDPVSRCLLQIMPLCFFIGPSDPRLFWTLEATLKPPHRGGLGEDLSFREPKLAALILTTK
ncbi:MAG: hypothetical protein BJ554DRAFT_3664, partial [Olpidium bornovanus]